MQRTLLNQIIHNSIKGNSLVEVLVAIVITVSFSSLAGMVYLNIQRSNLPFFRIKAVELAEAKMSEIRESKSFGEETLKAEEFTLKKKVVRNVRFPDCYSIRIMVFDVKKKKILEFESTLLSKK